MLLWISAALACRASRGRDSRARAKRAGSMGLMDSEDIMYTSLLSRTAVRRKGRIYVETF